MKLVYFDQTRNFGDVLNKHLFPTLFPELPWDVEDNTHFIGVGSILDRRLNFDGVNVVFGSGIRSNDSLPDITKGRWDFRFVRGPVSARALNAPYITDAAYAYALLHPAPTQLGKDVAFVPHYATSSTDGAIWRDICAEFDVNYIDPEADFFAVEQALRSSKLVISEAMHGAIFADINRIPWLPCRGRAAVLEGDTNSLKWTDWTSSIDVELKPYDLPIFWKEGGVIKHGLKCLQARRLMKKMLNAEPFLSADAVYQSKLAQLEEAAQKVRAAYGVT